MQMSDLRDLEARLVAALDRMRAAYTSGQEALRVARGQATLAKKELDEARAEIAAQPEAADDSGALEAAQAQVASLTAELDTAHGNAQKLSEALEQSQAQQARSPAGEGAARLGALRDSVDVEQLQDRVTQLETAMSQLRDANAQLRTNNSALREAHASGIADPDLINSGLAAELQALKATRAADRAEIDSVLAALQPLLSDNPAEEGAQSDA